MTSLIDPTVPPAGLASTATVRLNFLRAKTEIDALQLIAAATNVAPKLYKTTVGPQAYLKPKGAVSAISYQGRIISFDNQNRALYLDSNGWHQAAALPAASATGVCSALFLTGTGAILASPVGAGGIWRSADHGATWTKVCAFANNDAHVWTFAQDDSGNIYATTYGSATTHTELFKSTNDGTTWANIAGNPLYVDGVNVGTMASKVSRHWHCIHYCRHRQLLIASYGDAGAFSPLVISHDAGATWHAWGHYDRPNNYAKTQQATSITSDATAVYYASDTGYSSNTDTHDLGIYRATHAAASPWQSLLDVAPQKVWDGEYVNNAPVFGFAAQAYKEDDGTISFLYGSSLNRGAKPVVSIDGGNTWHTPHTTATPPNGGYGSFAPNFAAVSHLYTGAASAFRIATANDDGVFFYTFHHPATVYPAYTDHSITAQYNAHPAETTVLNVSFDTPPTPTASEYDYAQAPILQDATGPSGIGPWQGSHCAKFPLGGAGSYSILRWNGGIDGLPDGSEWTIDARLYIEMPSLPLNMTLFTLNGSMPLYIGVQPDGSAFASTAGTGQWGSLVSGPQDAPVPLNAWFRFRVIIKKHATNGTITVLVNDKIAIHAWGVPTHDGDQWQFMLGPVINNATGAVYADALKLTKTTAAQVPARTEPI